jgi:hypothetical protein
MKLPVGLGVSQRNNAMHVSTDISKAQRILRLVKSSATKPVVRRGGPAPAASSYYQRIENFALKICGTDDLATIINILDEALGGPRAHHGHTGNGIDPGALADAERRIEALTMEVARLRALIDNGISAGAFIRGGFRQTSARAEDAVQRVRPARRQRAPAAARADGAVIELPSALKKRRPANTKPTP